MMKSVHHPAPLLFASVSGLHHETAPYPLRVAAIGKLIVISAIISSRLAWTSPDLQGKILYSKGPRAPHKRYVTKV